MIARIWKGTTRAADADAYLEYLRDTGLAEYRDTPGNAGVLGLRRVDGDEAGLLLLTLWDSEEAIRGFAGDDIERAVFYPEDDRFLVERDAHVTHLEVVHRDGDGGRWPSTDTADRAAPAPRGSAPIGNRTPLTGIAPDIYRKRLLIEGFYGREVSGEVIADYFRHLTGELDLRTYGDPIIHRTSGEGREVNEGFDGFVPLVDSGIYIAAWVNPRFLSTIVYTCGPFDEERAVTLVRDFFQLERYEAAVF